MLETNNDWTSGSTLPDLFAQLGAVALEAGSKDAAFTQSTAGGVYTVQVAANDGGTGVALAEVYDADQKPGTPLVNISARSVSSRGDGVLIAGFVLQGNAPVTLLVRGLGPMVSQFKSLNINCSGSSVPDGLVS